MFDVEIERVEGNMVDFAVIQNMKNGRYLGEDGWVKDKNIALWFETEMELRMYAKKLGLDKNRYLIDIVML